MTENKRKTILLGVTAGISCYKSADLCSKLAAKYEVYVTMTPNALKLISDRIFFTLSRNPVTTDLFHVQGWMPGHVALEEKCDLMVVAPATINFIAKYTHGIADDALTTIAQTFRKTMLLAPAANTNMLASPACQDNMRILRERGVHFVGPETGRLACGTNGNGRMSEVPQILAEIERLLGE